MTCRHSRVLPILVAAVLACFSLSAHAIPKVAEHEDAPVTVGADVAHPKSSTKAVVQKKAGKKSKPAAKAKSGRANGGSSKAIRRKK